MKIAIVTDAWLPQVNGVVRTYQNTGRELEAMGHDVLFVTPDLFRTVPCPTYPQIQLAVLPGKNLVKLLEDFSPESIHVATEGPLGHSARSWCVKNQLPFTTSFHTQFPEYIRLRAPIPVTWSYAYLRKFHGKAVRTFVPTKSQKDRLVEKGFRNIVLWGRGVNTETFRPGTNLFEHLPGPVFMYMGRVAVEKNIEAFLDMDVEGSKVVVGDGPDLGALKLKYTDVLFTGFKFGKELADHIASADVFVFPSLTDTFGIVLLESMACGVPVAAYPVTGPIDVVINGKTGILNDDLKTAAMQALKLNPKDCIEFATSRSWRTCTEIFFQNLEPVEQYAGCVNN